MSERTARQRDFLLRIKTLVDNRWSTPGLAQHYADDDDRRTMQHLDYCLEVATGWCFAGKPQVSCTRIEDFVSKSLAESEAQSKELQQLRERNAHLERLLSEGGPKRRER